MAMPTSGPSFLLPTPGLASPQQHQQQQQQMHMQQPQMMVAPPPVAPPAPIPLDAVTLSVKLATMAGEQFKVRNRPLPCRFLCRRPPLHSAAAAHGLQSGTFITHSIAYEWE
jgi:hypothetical protein